MAKSPAAVSVIVPVRNAASRLGAQLDALAGQDYSDPWEVVVVDDGSTDDSRVVAEAFVGRLNLRVVGTTVAHGPAHARNVGASHATSTKLLFVDADDEVAPSYLAAMAQALDSFGFVAPRFDHSALNAEFVRGAHGAEWQEAGIDVLFDFLPAAGGTGLGVRREVFEAVGGFDESLPAAEDIAFCWDVQLAGTELRFVPEAIVRVRYRPTLLGLFRQTRAQGAALPLLFRRYRHHGMARRVAVRAWGGAVLQLLRARDRKDVARGVALLGYRVGRLEGSIRHRVLYL